MPLFCSSIINGDRLPNSLLTTWWRLSVSCTKLD